MAIGLRNFSLNLTVHSLFRDGRNTIAIDGGLKVWWRGQFEREKINELQAEIVSMILDNAKQFIHDDLMAAAADAPAGWEDAWRRTASSPGRKKIQTFGNEVHGTYTKSGEQLNSMVSGFQLGDKEVRGTDSHRGVLKEIGDSLQPGGYKHQQIFAFLESNGFPVRDLNVDIVSSLSVVNPGRVGRRRVRHENLSRKNAHMIDIKALYPGGTFM